MLPIMYIASCRDELLWARAAEENVEHGFMCPECNDLPIDTSFNQMDSLRPLRTIFVLVENSNSNPLLPLCKVCM
uniref:Zf-AD domain-containing protein n=1 Tax=Syphacia muris TaxID=451379 RepID=A0A0N5AA25_9BILA